MACPLLWAAIIIIYNISESSTERVDFRIKDDICFCLGMFSVLQAGVSEDDLAHDALFSHLTYLVFLHYLAKQETQKTAHWCICMQRSLTAAALLSSFLLNHAPNSLYR